MLVAYLLVVEGSFIISFVDIICNFVYNLRMNLSYVYILTNYSRSSLYIGVTSDLSKRLHQHATTDINSYTHKYKINILVYYESFNDINLAINREKQLKGWSRSKKEALIKSVNPKLENIAIKFGL